MGVNLLKPSVGRKHAKYREVYGIVMFARPPPPWERGKFTNIILLGN